MTRRPARRRRRFAWSGLVLPGVLALASLLGLALLGSSLGWWGAEAPTRRGAPAGTIAVPAAAVAIPTYTRVRLEHLVDPRIGDLRAVYLPEGSILPETLVDAKAIIGRVVAVDKRPGQVFSTNDFFPEGTREGLVAGIPPGKRALRIDASKVNGIVGLARGDRFDLIATLDLGRGRRSGVVIESAARSDLGALGPSVQSSLVVENGAVVQPLETRSIPGRTTQLVEEMVVAVEPGEVELLTQALHSGARIDCVPRSGRPSSAGDGPSPSASKRAGRLNVVETISGGRRSAVAVPSSGPAPEGEAAPTPGSSTGSTTAASGPGARRDG